MVQYELNVNDYWRIIKRRKWIIIFTSIAVLGSVVVFTNLQVPIYQASATVKIEPTPLGGMSADQSGWDQLTALNTEIKIIKSSLMAERTAKKLGLLNENMAESEKASILESISAKTSAERIGESNLVVISAVSSTPKETVKLANATAEGYIEKGIEDKSRRARDLREFIETQMNEAQVKLKTSEDNLKHYTEKSGARGLGGYLNSKLRELESRRNELSEKYTEEHPQVKLLSKQIENVKDQMKSLPTEDLECARLARELAMNEQLYTLLARRFKDAQISEDVEIITPQEVE